MYGLIGKMTSKPGQRDALVALLLQGAADMPGCLSYIVARDTGDEDAVWITEVWADESSHHDSLQLPSVRDAIAEAMPLIAGFEPGIITDPVGGVGLSYRMDEQPDRVG
jgi:quinol monooxygenase YgiN